MAFGKNKNTTQRDDTQSQSQVEQTSTQASNENFILVEDDYDSQPQENQSQESQVKKKPLLDEVTMVEKSMGKNAGGTKRWKCNHCNKSYSSSYTRIHHHFFGPPVGVKAEIARCSKMLADRTLLQQIRTKVEEAEKAGVSPSLTRSSVNIISGTSNNPIKESFGIVERHEVDIAIVRFLCANGIPFNVLRSPEMTSMIRAVNNAPKDYKHPSFDRARTSLLDDCKRVVEKECSPITDTWVTQGTSIVSDGWTNIKKKPLINVIASNSRGSMFLYANDFSGVEKTGKEISNYLLKSIDEIGPSNVLQVITDNAANCKAAGKEIEKYVHFLQRKYSLSSFNLLGHTAPAQAASLLVLGPFLDYWLTNKRIDVFEFNIASTVFMILSCTIAVGTNLSQFICIGRFTAVSFQVLGHMKTILVLILGFIFFGNEGLNIQVVIGMIIAVCGMIWYGNASSKPGGKERRSHSISRSSQQKHGGSAESSEIDEKV